MAETIASIVERLRSGLECRVLGVGHEIMAAGLLTLFEVEPPKGEAP